MPEPESQEGLLRELAAHGVERDEIDIVLLTSRPHRPRRMERAGRRQRAPFRGPAISSTRMRSPPRGAEAERAHIGRCVLGVEDRIETVADGQEIAPGVSVVELPGHDDGHIGLLVGDDAVIVADAVPHPAQLEHPEWTFGYDEDHQRAIETRRRIRDDFGDRLIYMSHLAGGWHR